jgi:hypothetical protein
MFRKKGRKDTSPMIDRILIDLWRTENEVRQAEGMPPITFREWYAWYSQRHGDGQGGGKE